MWTWRRTYRATVELDRYVRNADRDRWLVEHPGIPFPPSILTPAEVRAEAHIRRLHDQSWNELRTLLIVKWVLVGFFSCTLLGGRLFGVLMAAGTLGAMAAHHSRERRMWHELRRPIGVTSSAPVSAEEAARIVAEWEPPMIVIPVQGPAGRRSMEGPRPVLVPSRRV